MDEDLHKDPPEILPLRFARVVSVQVASSLFFLSATIHFYFEKYHPFNSGIVEQLLPFIHGDDVSRAEDEESAYQLYTDSKTTLQEEGFNLKIHH